MCFACKWGMMFGLTAKRDAATVFLSEDIKIAFFFVQFTCCHLMGDNDDPRFHLSTTMFDDVIKFF